MELSRDDVELREATGAAGRILILDQDSRSLRILWRILESDGHCVEAYQPDGDRPALAARIAAFDPRVILLDPGALCGGGPEWVGTLSATRPQTALFVLTGETSVESAVRYVRRGAADYFSKSSDDLGRLRATIRRTVAAEPGPTGMRPRSASREQIPLSLEAYERHALERALRESSGDAVDAARRLGIGRSTLYRKLARHGLQPRLYEGPGPCRAPRGRGAGADAGARPGVGGGRAIR